MKTRSVGSVMNCSRKDSKLGKRVQGTRRRKRHLEMNQNHQKIQTLHTYSV
jgi:hypothetical protein